MSTKEEHMLQLVWNERSELQSKVEYLIDQVGEALAERDAARAWKPKLLEAIGAVHGEYTDEHAIGLVRELAKERDALRQDRQRPEPAQVVGGVTEAMLDEIGRCSMPRDCRAETCDAYQKAFDAARAAIRAQQQQPPVDREAIREVACRIWYHYGKKLLRAIGDEPGEPASAPQAEPTVLCTHTTPNHLTINAAPPAPAEAKGPTHTERLVRFVMDAAALDLQPWISSVGEVHFQDHLTVTDAEAAAVRAALLGGAAEQGRLVKPPTDEDRWSDLDRAWAVNAKKYLQSESELFGHDEDVTFDQALEGVRRRLSLKPPETREEKLRALVDLAWELGDECLIWDKEVHVSVALMNDAERTMLLAHRDEKRKVAESAKDGGV